MVEKSRQLLCVYFYIHPIQKIFGVYFVFTLCKAPCLFSFYNSKPCLGRCVSVFTKNEDQDIKGEETSLSRQQASSQAMVCRPKTFSLIAKSTMRVAGTFWI